MKPKCLTGEMLYLSVCIGFNLRQMDKQNRRSACLKTGERGHQQTMLNPPSFAKCCIQWILKQVWKMPFFPHRSTLYHKTACTMKRENITESIALPTKIK